MVLWIGVVGYFFLGLPFLDLVLLGPLLRGGLLREVLRPGYQPDLYAEAQDGGGAR